MAAFIGYYDTGGAEHQGRMVVTAGVVATVGEWSQIDKRWMRILRREQLATFHMKEIAHWRGDIAKWPLVDGKRDEARRRALFDDLLNASVGIRQAFVRAVILDEYNDFDARYKFTETVGGAYTIAQAQCLIQSQEWLSDRSTEGGQHYWKAVVEQGDAGQKAFRRFCESALTYMPAFVPKLNDRGEVITPLALADLIAYEHHHLYTAVKTAWNHGLVRLPNDKRSPRISRLKATLPIDASLVTGESLDKMREALEVEARD